MSVLFANQDETEAAAGARAQYGVIALFCWFVGAIALGLCVLHRRDFNSPLPLLMTVSGAAAFALTAPLLLPARAWTGTSTIATLPILTLVAALCAPMVAVITGVRGSWVLWLLALPGIWRLRETVGSRTDNRLWLVLAVAPVLALHLFCQVQSRSYAHVLAPEFALMGWLERDVYFHGSVAHMILQTLTSSIGADGALRLTYHVAAHSWYAGVCGLSGSTPVVGYTFGQLGALVPCLFAAVMALATLAAATLRAHRLIIATVLCAAAFDAISLNSYYISESYTLALIGLMAFAPFVMHMATAPLTGASQHLRWVATSCAAIGLIGSSKISVALVLGCCVGWLLLRRFRLSLANIAAGASMLAVMFATKRMFDSSDISPDHLFQPLSYFRKYPLSVTVPSLLLPATLLTVATRARWWQDAQGDGGGRRLLLESFAMLFAASIAPTLLFNIDGGSAWYFQNIAHWLAFAALLALLARWAPPQRWTQGPRLKAAVVVALLAVAAQSAIWGTIRVGRFHQRLATTQADEGGESSTTTVDSTARVRRSFGAKLVEAVKRFDDGHDTQGAVFIPPANKAFWSFPEQCVSRSHLVAALTGVPMLLGLPPKGDSCRMYYRGLGDYPETSRSREVDKVELCRHAATRGVARVLILRDLYEPARNMTVECK